jgi:hypothetical protein
LEIFDINTDNDTVESPEYLRAINLKQFRLQEPVAMVCPPQEDREKAQEKGHFRATGITKDISSQGFGWDTIRDEALELVS